MQFIIFCKAAAPTVARPGSANLITLFIQPGRITGGIKIPVRNQTSKNSGPTWTDYAS